MHVKQWKVRYYYGYELHTDHHTTSSILAYRKVMTADSAQPLSPDLRVESSVEGTYVIVVKTTGGEAHISITMNIEGQSPAAKGKIGFPDEVVCI